MKLLVWLCVVIASISYVHGKRAMLMGGNVASDNDELWTLCVELSGGLTASRIGVITAGAVDPAAAYNAYAAELLARGADEVYWIPVHMGNLSAANDPEIIDYIANLTGFFFGGEDGQSSWFVDSLFQNGREDTGVLAAIRAQWNSVQTSMVIGNGVGAQALTSGPMLISGRSYNSLIEGSFPRSAPSIPTDAVVYDALGGLGFIDKYIIDAYFSERGNEGRLNRLLSDTVGLYNLSVPWGLGLDENTGLVINDVGQTTSTGQVKGVNGVHAIDATERIEDATGPYMRVDNMIYHYITHNDDIEMIRLVINWATSKTDLDGQETAPSEYNSADVFGPARGAPGNKPEFLECAISVFNSVLPVSAYGTTTETTPAMMKVDFFETDSRKRAAIDVDGHISYSYMLVSMYPL